MDLINISNKKVSIKCEVTVNKSNAVQYKSTWWQCEITNGTVTTIQIRFISVAPLYHVQKHCSPIALFCKKIK